MLPPWALAAGGAALLVVGFGSGWQVHSWKADSEKLEEVTLTQAAIDLQRKLYDTAAMSYEDTRASLDAQAYDTQTIIRETFREVPVPAECAVPELVADSLRASVEATNRAVTGEPAGKVSGAPTAPDPAH